MKQIKSNILKLCTIYWLRKSNKWYQIDNAEDIDAAKSMYVLLEYSDNYLKRSGSLWHYYRWAMWSNSKLWIINRKCSLMTLIQKLLK